MSKRRDELRALLSNAPKPPPQPDHEGAAGEGTGAPEPAADVKAEPRHERAASGAVKAMGLQLGHLRAGADEARTLRETLARGEAVIEIDPARIEPAFVADRLHPAGLEDDRFEALKASIREGGQEVPVLVRPHPDPARARAGDYQAAYGHRRIAAARALGLPVRAVVRALSDEALVVAQGKENAERRDLSFIERAFFAKALIDRGFERRVAESALGIHKTEMTRLLQVAEAVPRHLVEAIGPAPRVGRPRWLALAERLDGESAMVKMQDEIGSERFRAAPTDERFALVLQRLTQVRPKAGEPEVVKHGGAEIATLTRAKRATRIEIAAPDFAEFVAKRLPELHAAFEAEREAGDET